MAITMMHMFVNAVLCTGLGIGLQCYSETEDKHSTSPVRSIVTVILSVAIAQASQFIHIPAEPLLLFYVLVAMKIAVVIFLVVVAGFFTGANNHSGTKRQ